MVRLSNDGRIFFNGALAAQGDGRTLDPILITEKAVAGQKVLVAVNTPYHAENGRLTGAQLMVDYPGQPDPGAIRTDIQSAEEIVNGFPDGKDDHQRQLDAAVKAIDFAALDRGDQPAFTHSLEAANHGLAPLRDWMQQFTVKLVGNAHIDMAWLWPWTETVEVVRDTFTTALQLMREYPGFTFAQSSVQDYDWLREKYPAEFREIQQRVKEGRWELVGGMWVEPDLNMPDGEGLVRQLLVGTRFFKKYFDKETTIGWNPDSFGYSWQLPQIYKRSGFDTFVTQKMSWNETNLFPYKLFWWESPDGSRVLTYFPHGYSGGINPVQLSQDVADYTPEDHFPEIMHLYGVGDHGGGPTRQMLDEALKMESPPAIFPKTRIQHGPGFFDDLEKKHSAGNSEAAGVERRAVPAISSRLLHHAIRDQAPDPLQRRAAAKHREICVPRLSGHGHSYPNGRIRRYLEARAVRSLPRHHAGIGDRHQLCRCRAQSHRCQPSQSEDSGRGVGRSGGAYRYPRRGRSDSSFQSALLGAHRPGDGSGPHSTCRTASPGARFRRRAAARTSDRE